MNAPDRIFIHPTERSPVGKDWKRGKWKDHDSGASGDVEYIRADLVPQWQPIETARKDGTYVIGLFNGVVAQMKWSNGGRRYCYHWMALGRWTPIEPTHWIPMPEPPNIKIDKH